MTNSSQGTPLQEDFPPLDVTPILMFFICNIMFVWMEINKQTNKQTCTRRQRSSKMLAGTLEVDRQGRR